jgi:hypothetical protein
VVRDKNGMNTTADTLQKLGAITVLDMMARDLASGQPVDADVAVEWMRQALRHWERGLSLEAALGLDGSCRVRRRNQALIAAADLIQDGRNLSAWQLSGLLAARLQQFEQSKLIAYRRGVTVNFDSVESHLLAAAESGAVPMRSQRRLYELLKTD